MLKTEKKSSSCPKTPTMSVALRTPIKRTRFFAHIFCILALASVTTGQEMEPRAYSRAPLGSQFVVVSYAYQSGDVLLDSSLPLRDVKVKLNLGSIGYARTFGIAGRQASVSVLAPYIAGRVAGTVFEDRHEVRRSGLGDLRIRFSTILKGGPALSPREFATTKPRRVVGASLTVVAPTGQYDPRRLVNIGSNRWSFKPELGLSQPLGRWTLEFAGGVWLFTENPNFFGGSRRQQRPLTSLQANVIYTLRPRMWLSLNGTYYTGGRTIINGVTNADVQKNSRLGPTFSLPLTKSQSLKIAWAKGLTARFGGDLNTIAVAWQYAWF